MPTTKEAAQRLGLKTTGAVRQFILDGRLKGEKRGRDWWIEEEELERFSILPRKVGKPKRANDSHNESHSAQEVKEEG